ncbi:hypothetical protein K469DRAFT_794914 [Zopfia rhizophila CBS 207.26]|uniref:Uncharacterized protein n=1 Tax=Zopfia rhizophila CBS 207.26 TaxID=1314779 RepID=A0A6A6ENS6_9PEZI|nr:hypothetical protein K469DRAFT_794914 [Zopfia rhizophila CBS 207.26]
MTLITFCPLLSYLHDLTQEGKRTSWFKIDSKHYTSMPVIRRGAWRLRWLLKEIKKKGCPKLQDLDVNNADKGALIQALLATIADYTLLRQEKMIVWTAYPFTQDLVTEFLMDADVNATEAVATFIQYNKIEAESAELQDRFSIETSYLTDWFMYSNLNSEKQLMRMSSEEGQNAIAVYQALHDYPDSWLPVPLEPEAVIHHLIEFGSTRRVRQHGGFREGATVDLFQKVKEELNERLGQQ